MTYAHINAAREIVKGTTLGQPARHVLLVLSTYTNVDGRCWPSVAELVEVTGLSRRSVMYALRALERASIVRVEHRPRRGNRYWIGATRAPMESNGATSAPNGAPRAPNGAPRAPGTVREQLEEQAPRTGEPVDEPGAAGHPLLSRIERLQAMQREHGFSAE